MYQTTTKVGNIIEFVPQRVAASATATAAEVNAPLVCSVRFDDKVTVFPARGRSFFQAITYDVPIPWISSAYAIHERDVKPIKGPDIRCNRNLHSASRAVRDAKYLAHKLGMKCDTKRAVIWDGNVAYVHRPHPKQRPRPGFPFNPIVYERAEAVELLQSEWNLYSHTGDVPKPPGGVTCEGVVGDASIAASHTSDGAPIQAVAATPVASTVPRLNTDWIIDSGASIDLVSQADVAGFSKNVRRSSNPVSLSTANGVVPATRSIVLDVPGLEDYPEHYVLQSTPNALSMGIRCMKLGYAFHWEPFSEVPQLVTPSGYAIDLKVRNYIPTLTKDCRISSSTAAPAASSSSARATAGGIAVNRKFLQSLCAKIRRVLAPTTVRQVTPPEKLPPTVQVKMCA